MASGQQKVYRDAGQQSGYSCPPLPKGVPMNANPVTKTNPGLGAKTIAHPFKAGKPSI